MQSAVDSEGGESLCPDTQHCAKETVVTAAVGGGGWDEVHSVQMELSWWRLNHISFCRSLKGSSSGRAACRIIKYVFL